MDTCKKHRETPHRETEIKALPRHGIGREHPGTGEKSTGSSKRCARKDTSREMPKKEQEGEFLTVKVAGRLGVGNTEKPLGFVTRSLEDLTVSLPEAECEDEAK